MKQVFTSNPNYSLSNPILDTQIKFLLNTKGRLSRIIWRYETSSDGIRENSWGNEEQESWDLEGDATQYDLMRAFKRLAFGNPADFKELYFALKEHDNVVFPIIQQTLKKIQELYNFD